MKLKRVLFVIFVEILLPIAIAAVIFSFSIRYFYNWRSRTRNPVLENPIRISNISPIDEEDFQFNFTIVHTNDLHSHIDGNGPDSQDYLNEPIKRGHLARMAHFIRNLQKYKREIHKEPTLTFDAGDWFTGTLFSMLGISPEKEAVPELEFFDRCNYDAVILGNHEFEYSTKHLALMLKKAQKLGLRVPFVLSNIQMKDPNEPLRQFFCNYNDEDGSGSKNPSCDPNQSQVNIRPYLIKKLYANVTTGSSSSLSSLTVGIIGLYGVDSSFLSAHTTGRRNISFVGFDDIEKKGRMDEYIEHAQKLAQFLKNKHNVDIVVAVAHSGYGEDEQLMKGVPEIDIHISGHTHRAYTIVMERENGNKNIGGTTYGILSQTGCYGFSTGVLELSFFKKSKRLILRNKIPDEKELQDNGSVLRSSDYSPSSPSHSSSPSSSSSVAAATTADVNPYKQGEQIETSINMEDLPTIVPIRHNMPLDDIFSKKIDKYKEDINELLANQFKERESSNISKFRFDTPIFKINKTVSIDDHRMASRLATIIQRQLVNIHKENERKRAECLSRLDKEKEGVQHCPTFPDVNTDIYTTEMILIRSSLISVKEGMDTIYQYSDIFKLFGATSHYSIVTFYLRKEELIDYILDFQYLWWKLNNDEYMPIYSENLQIGTRKWGIPFINRIDKSTTFLNGKPYSEWPHLIQIATVELLVRFFYALPSLSFGLLNLLPRDSLGNQIPTLEDFVKTRTSYLTEHDVFSTYMIKKGGFNSFWED